MEELGREEQMVGVSNKDASATHIGIAKGKRTKRLRLFTPSGVAVMTSSCSSASGGDNGSFSSTTTTYESIDQEEEDMAYCLILLAQGGAQTQSQSHHKQQVAEYHDDHDHGDGNNNKTEKGSTSNNRRFAEIATATATTNTNTNTKVGFHIYECKTCNRTFPSFQALGGHRASHKKPKLMLEDKKPLPPPPPPPQPQPVTNNYDEFEEGQPRGATISLRLGSNGHRAFHGNKLNKIHECSICGSEFTSGQALGGHMRRHRTSSSSTNAPAETADDGGVRSRNILELDLNLPAPEDDLRESKFQFPATQKSMVLSAAPALVDCHY